MPNISLKLTAFDEFYMCGAEVFICAEGLLSDEYLSFYAIAILPQSFQFLCLQFCRKVFDFMNMTAFA